MSQLYLVTSLEGFLDMLHDCIVHGVFDTKEAAEALIRQLRHKQPRCGFTLTPVPVNTKVMTGLAQDATDKLDFNPSQSGSIYSAAYSSFSTYIQTLE